MVRLCFCCRCHRLWFGQDDHLRTLRATVLERDEQLALLQKEKTAAIAALESDLSSLRAQLTQNAEDDRIKAQNNGKMQVRSLVLHDEFSCLRLPNHPCHSRALDLLPTLCHPSCNPSTPLRMLSSLIFMFESVLPSKTHTSVMRWQQWPRSSMSQKATLVRYRKHFVEM
jgi:hypothetical protein